MVGQLIVSAPEDRLYQPLFISPEDADANNPMDRLQVANADDEGLRQVGRAIRYLDRSPTARATIDDGLRRGVKINLSDDARDAFDPVTHVVNWDPRSQLRLQNSDGTLTNDHQSPAMGLGHEFDHINDRMFFGRDNEARLRLDYERPVAGELGEPPQARHTGWLYRTNDPTSRVPGVFDTPNTAHGKEIEAFREAERERKYAPKARRPYTP